MSSVNLLRGMSAYGNASSMSVQKGLDAALSLGEDKSSTTGNVFSGLVQKVLNSSINTIRKSEAVNTAALTEKIPLHEIVTSVNEAEIALQTVVAVRDRVITAYQDIIKMPI